MPVKSNPVIIHSAIPGGIERYLYLLFNDFEEQGLPLADTKARQLNFLVW